MSDLRDDPKIDQYLDAMTAPFVGVVVPKDVSALREELRAHLTAILREEQASGKSEAEALDLAFARFGEPREVGRRLVRALYQAPGMAALTISYEAVDRPFLHVLLRGVAKLCSYVVLWYVIHYADLKFWNHGNLADAAVVGTVLGVGCTFALLADRDAIPIMWYTVKRRLFPRLPMRRLIRLPQSNPLSELIRRQPGLLGRDGTRYVPTAFWRPLNIIRSCLWLIMCSLLMLFWGFFPNSCVPSTLQMDSWVVFRTCLFAPMMVPVITRSVKEFCDDDRLLLAAIARLNTLDIGALPIH